MSKTGIKNNGKAFQPEKFKRKTSRKYFLLFMSNTSLKKDVIKKNFLS